MAAQVKSRQRVADHGIKTVYELSQNNKFSIIDVTHMASKIYDRTNGRIQCVSIEDLL